MVFVRAGATKLYGPLTRNALLTISSLVLITLKLERKHDGTVSVIDGVVVTLLCPLIFAGTHCLPYVYEGGIGFAFLAAKVIAEVFYVAFCLFFWTKVSSFGSVQGCSMNPTAKFTLFGHTHSITSHGVRGFFIFVSTALLVISLWNALYACGIMAANMQRDDSSRVSISEHSSIVPLSEHSKTVLRLWTSVGGIIAFTPPMTIIELIIRWNNLVESANRWTFGQTIAVALAITSVLEFIVELMTPRPDASQDSIALRAVDMPGFRNEGRAGETQLPVDCPAMFASGENDQE